MRPVSVWARLGRRPRSHAAGNQSSYSGKDELRWNVVSLPTERVVKNGKYLMTTTARGEKLRKELAL